MSSNNIKPNLEPCGSRNWCFKQRFPQHDAASMDQHTGNPSQGILTVLPFACTPGWIEALREHCAFRNKWVEGQGSELLGSRPFRCGPCLFVLFL